MGYQEFVYKLDEPKQFQKSRRDIDKFMFNNHLEYLIDYDLVELKVKLAELEKGLYLFIYGERHAGNMLLKYLDCDKKIKSSYFADVETALDMYSAYGNMENSDKLKVIFKEKRTIYGNVLLSGPDKSHQLERSLI